MTKAIIHCGFGRSGTTMLYNMLRTTVTNYGFFDREMRYSAVADEEKVITKRPLDTMAVSKRRRIIQVRDPRAVVTSKHWSNPDAYFVSGERYITGLPGLIQQWDAIKDFDGYFVRYEDVVAGPDRVQNDMAGYFGFEYNGRFRDFHKADIPPELALALNGKRPLDTGHDWREHMDRVNEQFDRFPRLQEIMDRFGYTWETDR